MAEWLPTLIAIILVLVALRLAWPILVALSAAAGVGAMCILAIGFALTVCVLAAIAALGRFAYRLGRGSLRRRPMSRG